MPKSHAILFLVITGIALVVAIESGPQHDYRAYLDEWELVLNGEDPWVDRGESATNAYGPLFNVLALLADIHPLAPKVAFVLTWVGLAIWLNLLAAKQNEGRFLGLLISLTLLLSPFFWIEIPLFGHFDILLACCSVAAVHLYRKGRSVASGVVLAASVLLKFMPIVLLPVFAMNRGRVNFRFGWAFLAAFGYGIACSFSLWGRSVLSPFVFAQQRRPKLLSIHSFFAGAYSPLPANFGSNELFNSSLIAIGVLALTTLVCWLWRLPPTRAALALFFALLISYKVGHSQFHTTPIALILYYGATEPQVFRHDSRLRAITILYIGFLNLFNVLYVLTENMTTSTGLMLRHTVGLPAFFVECAFLWAILGGVGPENPERFHPVSLPGSEGESFEVQSAEIA